MNKEEILKQVNEANVQFVSLQFTDILGVLKNISIPVNQLDKALDGELMFDGSSIEGFVRIEESDMYLKPDLNTFLILPWDIAATGKTARLICDVFDPTGKPFEGCPRYILSRALKEADELGYTMNVGSEPEFFMFKLDDNGNPTLETNDQAKYFDMPPIDEGEVARCNMVETLNTLGFEVEAAHHESAPGQHEIDFKYTNALETADRIITFRIVVRTVARDHGLYATFMPKPIHGIAGSGMHMHISLFKDGKNAFYDPDKADGLSDLCKHFMAGVMLHAKGMAAITNPIVNSYKRLVPGYEAPVYIAWSYQNRSPLIRIPARRGTGTRIEIRNPDPTCNPYLGLAVILKAGLDGIKQKLPCPPSVDLNIYEMDLAERTEHGINALPENLYEAIQELSKDELIKEALGEHIYSRFILSKTREWEEYSKQVFPWEIKSYLPRY